MLYSIGIIITIGAIVFQIKAAKSVTVCDYTLPRLWAAIAIADLFFAMDSLPDIPYVVLFLALFIVMAISSRIVWEKAKK